MNQPRSRECIPTPRTWDSKSLAILASRVGNRLPQPHKRPGEKIKNKRMPNSLDMNPEIRPAGRADERIEVKISEHISRGFMR